MKNNRVLLIVSLITLIVVASLFVFNKNQVINEDNFDDEVVMMNDCPYTEDDIREMKTIDVGVANQIVEKCGGYDLDFKNLTTMDVSTAKELIKAKSDGLFLTMSKIPENVLSELVKFSGGWLSFDFKTITLNEAKILSSRGEGTTLYLDKLVSLNTETAKELAKAKVNSLSLNGLGSISDSVAMELSKFQGNQIICNPSVARMINKNKQGVAIVREVME